MSTVASQARLDVWVDRTGLPLELRVGRPGRQHGAGHPVPRPASGQLITSSVLIGLDAAGGVRGWLPTRYWLAWVDLFRDPILHDITS